MHPALDALTALGLLLLFGAAQWLGRLRASPESTRAAVHVVGAGVVAAFPLYLGLPDVLLLGVAFTAFLVVTWARGSVQSVHGVRRPTVGALVFPPGLMAAAIVAWPHPAAFSFAAIVLALADPTAHWIGLRVNSFSWRVPGGSKSMSGSLAFFAIALLLALLFTETVGRAGLISIVAVALILTAVEGALGYGLDNLPIPIAAALLGQHVLGL